MKRLLIIFIITLIFNVCSYAQLEKVIVERYYLSDEVDATDLFGGGVDSGTVTYRVYLDLVPGTILRSIYGDESHPFIIASTDTFFNNVSDGQTFAKEFIRNRYLENTVALDTWLTLGQTAKKQGEWGYFGVLKSQDINGSFIGGDNNDGGSEEIEGGLLTNEDPTIGIPLVLADGMDTSSVVPGDWYHAGVLDFISGNDSTIFGSLVPGVNFHSNGFILSCDGVMGQRADSNQVIIAQLSTKGELSFTLNVELEYMEEGNLVTKKYVGTNVINSNDEEFNPNLNYPPLCGCMDPEYLEFDPAVICPLEGSCIHTIVFGCMDTLACNYDPESNVNIEELCCYPGFCLNRNIEEVCPQILGDEFKLKCYPNPAEDMVLINLISGEVKDVELQLLNYNGHLMWSEQIASADQNLVVDLSLSEMPGGVYTIIAKHGSEVKHKLLVKL